MSNTWYFIFGMWFGIFMIGLIWAFENPASLIEFIRRELL